MKTRHKVNSESWLCIWGLFVECSTNRLAEISVIFSYSCSQTQRQGDDRVPVKEEKQQQNVISDSQSDWTLSLHYCKYTASITLRNCVWASTHPNGTIYYYLYRLFFEGRRGPGWHWARHGAQGLTHNLKSLINLTTICMFLDYIGGSQGTKRLPTQAQGEHAKAKA